MNDIHNTHLVLCFILLLTISAVCEAQRFENLNERFPIGLSEVLYQDREGYLWIGTRNGLYRYDGYEMIEFIHDPADTASISGNNINAIGQEPGGRMWIGIRQFGLNLLQPASKKFQAVCLPLGDTCEQNVSVNALEVCSEDEMWIGTFHGLYRFTIDEKPEFIKKYVSDESDSTSLGHSSVNHIFKDSKDRIWLGTTRGIQLYRPATDDFLNHRTNADFPSSPVLDIEEDMKGRLWVSTRFSEERLYYYDEDRKTFVVDTLFIGEKWGEFKICFDLENNMWISARKRGAYFVDDHKRRVTFYEYKNNAFHGFGNLFGVQTICDRYGNIWMSGEALYRWPNTGKSINHITSMSGKVHSIYSKQNLLWYSGHEPKVFNIEKGSHVGFLPTQLPTNVRRMDDSRKSYRRILKMLEYGENEIILCFFKSIVRWNFKTGQYIEFPLDIGGPLQDIALTQDSSRLWICTNQGSPLLLNLETGQIEESESSKSILHTKSVVRDQAGNFWFGSHVNGLYKLDPQDNVTRFYPGQEDALKRLPAGYVYDIAVSSKNIVWVASNRGVFSIDIATNTVESPKLEQELLGLNSISIITDDFDRIWWTNKKGIVRYDPASGTLNVFGEKDGLKNTKYISRAVHKGDDGTLYFGGNNGIDIVGTKSLDYNTIPPDVYLSEIAVNNEVRNMSSFSNSPRMSLAHDQNFIDIELLALHLTAPEANKYAYSIPQIDTVWRQLGSKRSFTLTNVEPGTYTIKARAANADDYWSEPEALITFDIQPPWWKTTWFISLGIMVMGSILFLGYKYRIRLIKQREHLKTKFNKRIAEVESKALRAQMNPHFLFNSINAVNSLISHGENDKASDYLKRFGQLIRLVLANSEQPMVRLEEELEALRLYLEIEQLRFQNFEYKIDVASEVEIDFIKVPPLILQPYVENAIWHGLLHKIEGTRNVHIEVYYDEDDLLMRVKDNGIGRKRAGKLKTRNSARKKGMGMRLTQDRLKIMEQLHGGEITTKVEDLIGDQGQAIGTLITIRISSPE